MSSKSPPSSALALNVNFKYSEIPDGYKYDGENFLTWTNGVTTATRQYPILTKLINGTAIRPSGVNIKASFNKPRLIEELLAEKRAFSQQVTTSTSAPLTPTTAPTPMRDPSHRSG